MTTIGKWRHISRVSTDDGHFVVMAIDHRTNLLEKLNSAAPSPYDDAAFAGFKGEVTASLVPYASGVLTDPGYGIGQGVVNGTLNGGCGLLAPVEVTDYGRPPSEREVEFIPGWTVEKLKMAGIDGVKMLLPYHPADDSTDAKHEYVEKLVAVCALWDVPFFLEPIPYSPDPGRKLTNAELLEISVGMCQTFSDVGVDVLKLPFPVDASQSRDVGEWTEACAAVDEACGVPWALLSAGVDFETFIAQAEVACKSGASGVIVGRAVWGEAVTLQGEERAAFLRDVAPARMRRLGAVAAAFATPWTARVETPESGVDWYQSYFNH